MGRLKFFHFSKSQGVFNPPSLDLSILEGSVLHPKENWQYLRFIFYRKLSFHQHVNFYVNKAISMVKSMKMLGNLSRSLIPSQRCLLYKVCILSITLYSFLLWFYNKVSLAYLLKVLRSMQCRAALWILGAFCTSLLLDIEAIVGLILIHLHFQKLGGRLQLQTHSLPSNYTQIETED